MNVCIMNNIKILYYERIDVSESLGVNIKSALKECIICHYWYFLDEGFQFQPDVCNRCHDTLMSTKLSNIAILNIQSVDCLCNINRISKSEAMGLLQNPNLNEKSGTFKTKKSVMYKIWVKKL